MVVWRHGFVLLLPPFQGGLSKRRILAQRYSVFSSLGLGCYIKTPMLREHEDCPWPPIIVLCPQT